MLTALTFVALPTLFAIVGGVEALLHSNDVGWRQVLGREVVYWTSWVVLMPPIFRLCRWLHEGPRSWPRYVVGLSVGVALTLVLLPLIYEILRLGGWAIAWKLSWMAEAPPAFWADYRGLFTYLITASVAIFAFTVIAWHAVTNYREAKESRVESAELNAMLQRAQLQALRSQLNPHFLFNTLHSIAELIHENPRQAEQMVIQLGELLRKALETQALEVTLREELEFIRTYLAIEQTRLGDRLDLAWRIDPAALHARVPSLLLQPIVENAIRHGIANSPRGGRLEISASRAGDQLRLEVRDDGPGLKQTAASTEGQGIGLGHTRARLERLYGARASFSLTGEHGVVASITLPWSE
ncbi:MAG: sensor histidine kinase [Opitutus sp.]|nr:sensor histidine kinase [Opitutus sp.]